MSKRKRKTGICPLCGSEYVKKHYRTSHHLFPKCWYNIDVTVDVCHVCHQVEFHYLYVINPEKKWSMKLCLLHWVDFCMRFDKNAFEVYPSLNRFKYLMPK